MAADDTVLSMPQEPERTVSARTWAIAALVVLILLAVAAIATLRRSPSNTGALLTPDAYAASLPITGVTMTEATNGAGGKSIYVDATIGNTGTKTLTGAVMQVTFNATDGTAPHRETLPLSLIRTREPYVDLQPVSADPVKPGDHKDFRLIFESVPDSWDVQPPAIQVIHADLK
jgi:hypothetical protein